MSAFIYEYRLAGEQKMHYVRASADDVAVRGVLESRHQRKVDLLMTTRTATPQDTFIQSAESKQIAASWDRFVAKVPAKRTEPVAPLSPAAYIPIATDSKQIAASWDRVVNKLTAKRRNEPVASPSTLS